MILRKGLGVFCIAARSVVADDRESEAAACLKGKITDCLQQHGAIGLERRAHIP
jgi:hypothetical protein